VLLQNFSSLSKPHLTAKVTECSFNSVTSCFLFQDSYPCGVAHNKAEKSLSPTTYNLTPNIYFQASFCLFLPLDLGTRGAILRLVFFSYKVITDFTDVLYSVQYD
jgi:hypothetical protein